MKLGTLAFGRTSDEHWTQSGLELAGWQPSVVRRRSGACLFFLFLEEQASRRVSTRHATGVRHDGAQHLHDVDSVRRAPLAWCVTDDERCLRGCGARLQGAASTVLSTFGRQASSAIDTLENIREEIALCGRGSVGMRASGVFIARRRTGGASKTRMSMRHT
jgi:hypothetical protein